MRYCKNCGLLVPFDAGHCPQCGAELPAAAPEAKAAAAPRYDKDGTEQVAALSEGATLGTLLLFSIPIAGFILSLAWSFGFTHNPARRRLAQAWLIRTLIVAVIVALICLWIGLNSALALASPHYYYAF